MGKGKKDRLEGVLERGKERKKVKEREGKFCNRKNRIDKKGREKERRESK